MAKCTVGVCLGCNAHLDMKDSIKERCVECGHTEIEFREVPVAECCDRCLERIEDCHCPDASHVRCEYCDSDATRVSRYQGGLVVYHCQHCMSPCNHPCDPHSSYCDELDVD